MIFFCFSPFFLFLWSSLKACSPCQIHDYSVRGWDLETGILDIGMATGNIAAVAYITMARERSMGGHLRYLRLAARVKYP